MVSDNLVDRGCVYLDGHCNCENPHADCKYSGKPFPKATWSRRMEEVVSKRLGETIVQTDSLLDGHGKGEGRGMAIGAGIAYENHLHDLLSKLRKRAQKEEMRKWNI